MKRVLFFLIIGICLIIINNLIHAIIDTWQKQQYLVIAQKDLQREQEEHQQLQQQLKNVSQQQFIEEQARDKLLLVKPGEQIVVIPTQLLSPDSNSSKVLHSQKPHWQEWFDYFFGQ